MRFCVAFVTLSCSLALASCQMARGFLPRTHTVSTSPDGRWTAWVRQELNPDPPDDHLFLKGPDGVTVRLRDLTPDVDWCQTIVWTRDSRRVGFLITDNRLAVFELSSRQHVADVVLVKIDGYPGSEEVHNLAFNDAGDAVTFDRAERWTHRFLSRERVRMPPGASRPDRP